MRRYSLLKRGCGDATSVCSQTVHPAFRNPIMRPDDATKDVHLHQFFYRINPDKELDSICAFCYMKAVTPKHSESAFIVVQSHEAARGLPAVPFGPVIAAHRQRYRSYLSSCHHIGPGQVCRKLNALFTVRKRAGEVGNLLLPESTSRLPIVARAKFICGFQHSRYARDLSALYALYALRLHAVTQPGRNCGGPDSQMNP
jgi:hypothetical protein